ncbi:MAG: CoA-binding protein [Bdellovibrionia bacterium]
MKIAEILKQYKRVTVVGISANINRPSNWISRYLQENQFEIIGVNPGLPKIQGIQVVATIQEVPLPLEIVDVFRNSASIPSLLEELRPLKPAVIWLQPGAQNPAAEEYARSLGIEVVSGNCIYEEHSKLQALTTNN